MKTERLALKAIRFAATASLMLLLAGCARPVMTIQKEPLAEIHGRLLVIEPARRWQAMLDWHASSPDQGWLRISHAASGRIIELRWKETHLWLRDNQTVAADWRLVSPDELASHGIVLLPNEMAAFFTGHPPADFSRIRPDQWVTVRGKNRIRVEWNGKRLTATDIKHGRQAIVFTR